VSAAKRLIRCEAARWAMRRRSGIIEVTDLAVACAKVIARHLTAAPQMVLLVGLLELMHREGRWRR
jgi:hypothetical protein